MSELRLDDAQAAVVREVVAPGSRVFVEGGPGTGKTTVALIAARSVLSGSRVKRHSRVLFITFSRSAAAQIDATMHRSSEDVEDRIEISTLDALALRILVAFGRYGGCRTRRAQVQSESSTKIRGIDETRYQYNELVPLACTLLKRSCYLLSLVRSRWCLVVCDEFQDVTAAQSEFVNLLCSDRLLLLGDRNQHIYGWLGADLKQFESTKSQFDVALDLGHGSYRDPSREFPRLASAYQVRGDIGRDTAKLSLTGRYQIQIVDDSRVDATVCELARTEAFSSDVAIFARRIETVTALSEVMSGDGIEYEIAGTSEVFAEAVDAMLTLCEFGLGRRSIAEVGLSLSSVGASLYRGKELPEISRNLMASRESVENFVDSYSAIGDLLTSMAGGGMSQVIQLVSDAWRTLRIGVGEAQWGIAAREFRRCAEFLWDKDYTHATVDELSALVEVARGNFLLDSAKALRSRIMLMTYNQSKGREFDTVIHVHRSDDFWGYPKDRAQALRLIGVAISRAKHKLVVVAPPDAHDYAQPFLESAGR